MMKKLLLLKKGVDVLRGISKKKAPSSAPGNKINDKFQGRFAFERAKTKKADKQRVIAAKSFAKTTGDFKTVPKKDRLILKGRLTEEKLLLVEDYLINLHLKDLHFIHPLKVPNPPKKPRMTTMYRGVVASTIAKKTPGLYRHGVTWRAAKLWCMGQTIPFMLVFPICPLCQWLSPVQVVQLVQVVETRRQQRMGLVVL